MLSSRLGALIIPILFLSSCGSNVSTSSPNITDETHPAFSVVGRWRQVSPAGDDVTVVFTSDGKLTYSIHDGDKIQVINMVYEISGNQIITDQPSNPRREISLFSFEPSGILVLDYDGEKTRFRREK